MAGRILGQGDILTMVETAQRELDQKQLAETEARLRQGEFTLDDFRNQLTQIAKPGLMQKMMGLLPGMGELTKMWGDVGEGDLKQLFGIIDSMTPEERHDPTKVIDQSRRRRIAAGAGVQDNQVNDLVKQFDGMASLMKQMAGRGVSDRMKMVEEMQKNGMLNPGGKIARQKQGTGKRLSPKERLKVKKQRERELRRRKREIRKK